MSAKPFTESQFVATATSTAKEKADFANALARFIESGFERHLFTKRVYLGLSTYCFGHIAHYNAGGFFTAWFSNTSQKVEFLDRIESWNCQRDPTRTWADVEAALAEWVRDRGLVETYRRRRAEETDRAEIDLLRTLVAEHPEEATVALSRSRQDLANLRFLADDASRAHAVMTEERDEVAALRKLVADMVAECLPVLHQMPSSMWEESDWHSRAKRAAAGSQLTSERFCRKCWADITAGIAHAENCPSKAPVSPGEPR